MGNSLKSFLWWTYPRGSMPYDVMVTLILAFIFIAPRYIDFHDKPAPTVAHATGDAYVIEPGHNAWVVGDEPFVGYEFESRAAEEYART